jgi:hypothetical protein
MAKTLDANTKEFTANGVKYVLVESLGIHRFWQFERYKVMLAQAINVVSIYNLLCEYYEEIPKIIRDPSHGMKLHHKLETHLQGLNDLNSRVPIGFYMATLFWNKEGEKGNEWTETLAEEKIKDWDEEDIDGNFFLLTCLPHIKDFLIIYKESIQKYLEVEELETNLITSLNL